ncbi:MAG: hypothetical protein JWM99_3454 [Verrucomicrobiales bacterium]|nr:hypothetical protein [Verrucomicrobiales bacterium]
MVLFEDCFDFKRPGSHSRSITYNIRKTNAYLDGPRTGLGFEEVRQHLISVVTHAIVGRPLYQ